MNYTILFVNTFFFSINRVTLSLCALSMHLICCGVDLFLPLVGPLIWKIKMIFYSILFYTRLHTIKSNDRNINLVLTTSSSTCGTGVLFMRK